MKVKLSLTILTILISNTILLSQVSIGQIDNFENGSTLNWEEGGQSPNPPTNIASGGPNGTDDNYLSNIAAGADEGSKMVMFNEAQWRGNYINQNVIGIKFHARAIGNTLNLRIAFDGDGGRICTINAVTITAGAAWAEYVIPINPSDFTTVSGGNNISEILQTVGTMRILSSNSPSWQGEIINATLEIDNIEALETLSSDDFEVGKSFKIYPNPGNSLLYFNSPNNNQTINLIVHDLNGKEIYNANNLSLSTHIDVTNWRPGLYIIKIISDDMVSTKRYLKI